MTTVLPIIVLYFLALAVVNDSGGRPRAVVLMDGFMRWLKLDGHTLVLEVIGFGCHGPSIMGTRVIHDRGMRLLCRSVQPAQLWTGAAQELMRCRAPIHNTSIQ